MIERDIHIDEIIESISLKAGMLDEGDIPVMGEILNTLSDLEELTPNIDSMVFSNIVQALQDYIEKLALGEKTDVKPLYEGVTALQAIWRDISNGQSPVFDVSNALETLGFAVDDKVQLPDGAENENKTDETINNDIKDPPKSELSDQDIGVLREFIVESRENLEAIELKLIALEQNPDDMNIIDAIFRLFHSIKGISGFLELDKIKTLCHHTEDLIDNTRQGKLVMDDEITDIILETFDTLNLMMEDIEKSLETRITTSFDGIDDSRLIEKIKKTVTAVETGEANKSVYKKEPLGKILIETGSISENDLREGLKLQKNKPEKKLGEILVKENTIAPKDIKSALKTQTAGKRSASLQVKVDTGKLDNLIDFTGELVIAQSLFRQIGLDVAANNQKYFQQLNQVTQTVSAIQKIAMSMRMVPVKNTFQKMFRLVRDLTRNSGKEADLSMSGEETEIDRNVVDELYEPMVHMIRNSVDHGLEMPADREAAGKNKKGLIHLRAFQKGGNIVIEIKDDGKGLDKNIILEKAIERNLASGDDNLSDKEIYSFIMQPGFSTAKEITDISGRGVGMDVVKKGIEKLRGRLEIDSETGKGTVFTISLPLTRAIVEGILVRVGDEKYIIPTHAILKSFRPDQQHCHTVEKKCEMVQHGENLIPLLRIERLFNAKSDTADPWDGIVTVVENHGEKKALLLDELLGKQEFVIKNLGETFKKVKGLAGSAILADGRVGLILDMSGLFEAAAG